MSRVWTFALAVFGLSGAGFAQEEATMNRKIDGLLARMTLEEKAGQLTQYTADLNVTGSTLRPNFRQDIASGKVGSILNAYGAPFTKELQALAVEKTRLKIPLLFGFDVIHGHRTVFPIPLAEASSWDLERIELAARTAAVEASADGVHWTFAPMVDVTRDPRWGRVMEGAGEDPWLGARIAEARVRGFQGSKIGAVDRVLACVKHFAAYGAPSAGRDYNSVSMSERDLMEEYMPPYKAAVDAGAATVMTSFNDLGGIPSTANRWLLTDLLRKNWGFRGFVVTDYNAVAELIAHGVAEDEKQATLMAFTAGSDMDMMSGAYPRHLPELVREKKITKSSLDRAVRRVLEIKYKLGLFDDPYRFSDETRAARVGLAREHLDQARDMARRSMVLLKNDGDVLPLRKEGVVAVVGPFADNRRDLVGSWSAAGQASELWREAVPLTEGVRQIAGGVRMLSAKGANLIEDRDMVDLLNRNHGDIEMDPRPPSEMVAEAVQLARQADVVVLALGEPHGFSGEAASRSRIRLPENQLALLKAVKAVGKPVVLVLFNGRPLALEQEHDLADAILEAWYPGTQGGPAVADVLFGDYNPSGKLTMTFPRNEGQIPIFYAHRNTGRPTDGKDKFRSQYLDVPNSPLYSFGHGLSYTRFSYSNFKLSSSKIRTGQKLRVQIDVTNSGRVAGEEIVQLYVHDLVASVARPVRELKGFAKVHLRPDQTRTVAFALTSEDLEFYGPDRRRTLEPGVFKVYAGGSLDRVLSGEFRLLGKTSSRNDSIVP